MNATAAAADWIEVTVAAPAFGHDDEARRQAVTLLRHLIRCQGYAQTNDVLVAYAPRENGTDAAVARLRGLLPLLFPAEEGVSVNVRAVGEDEWTRLWRAHYVPVRVGRVLFVPPWQKAFGAGENDLVIPLDPGDVFGTGLHPTTRLCLQALEGHVTPGDRVLDVGTGTGILALAAARWGAARVLALDERADAVQIARENVTRNGLETCVTVQEGRGVPNNAGLFDLIAHNIRADVIEEMAGPLAQSLRPGGQLIGSGFVASHEPAVASALAFAGLIVHETIRDDEWTCLVAQHESHQP